MTTVYVDLFPKLNSELMGVPLRAALYWRAYPAGTDHYAPHLPFAYSWSAARSGSAECQQDRGVEVSMSQSRSRRVPAFCPLCASRCGCEAVVEDGRVLAIEPNPAHPTGKALCAKGRASPALVEAPDRLLYPVRRTRPKGDSDPGWQRISWDEALDDTAAAMRRIAFAGRPEAVPFRGPT